MRKAFFNTFLQFDKVNLFVLMLLVGIGGPTFSHPILKISNSKGLEKTSSYLYYFQDNSRSFSFDKVKTFSIDKFKPCGDKISFGITKSDIWFKLSLKNDDPSNSDYLLEVSYPHLDSISFYDGDREIVMGDRVPFITREVNHRFFIFPISLSDTLSHTFYFKISGEGSKQIPLKIYSAKKFFPQESKVDLLYGMFFGVLLIMLLYNFFIYFSLKETSYLFYVVSNFSVLSFYAANTGYAFQYIWPSIPDINGKIIPITVLSTGLSFIFFARHFLNFKNFSIAIDTAYRYFAYLHIILLVGLLIFTMKVTLAIAAIMAFATSILVLSTSTYASFKGHKSARFVCLAFFVYSFGVIILALNVFGIVEKNFLTSHAMELGSLCEIVLLSLALSEKYRIIRMENEIAHKEIISIQQEANQALEFKVRERTEQIFKQNEKLEDLNVVKDKLLSLISHDVRGPLQSFQALLNLMRQDNYAPDKMNVYHLHLNNKLSTTLSMIDNILHWTKSQMKGMKFQLKEVDVFDVVKENIAHYASQAELKKIDLTNEINTGTVVYTDKDVLRLVVRNLISNALKFTHENGKVIISASEVDGKVVLQVKDTGVGMEEEMVNQLFNRDSHYTTSDTTQKIEGTGLGLFLSQEFLKQVSGEISVESEINKGSTFTVTLPKVSS
jgi:signal transduction histidine kinase